MKTYSSEYRFSNQDFPLHIHREEQARVIPLHLHDYIEIVLVSHGSTIHEVMDGNGQKSSYGLIQGDVLSVLPGEVHGYRESWNLILYNISLKQELIGDYLPLLEILPSWSTLITPDIHHVRNKIHLGFQERLKAETLLKSIAAELSLQPSGYQLYAKNELVNFLITAARKDSLECRKPEPAMVSNTGLLKTLCMMEENPHCAFKLSQLAKIAAMSITGYIRQFKNETGQSPMEYLIGLRLEACRLQLENGNDSVEKIASNIGFCDSNYLIRKFKQRYGLTPAKYRHLHRKNDLS